MLSISRELNVKGLQTLLYLKERKRFALDLSYSHFLVCVQAKKKRKEKKEKKTISNKSLK